MSLLTLMTLMILITLIDSRWTSMVVENIPVGVIGTRVVLRLHTFSMLRTLIIMLRRLIATLLGRHLDGRRNLKGQNVKHARKVKIILCLQVKTNIAYFPV